ncbi:MAG: hypothetical protein ACT4PY_05590 [Armatimonadota bacterium]
MTASRVLILPLVAALSISIASAGRPAGAQGRDLSRIRVLAVAPFADDDPTTRPLADHGVRRLTDLLRGGRFQIVDSARVAVEMSRGSQTAASLISPTQAVLLGMRVGADAILTGRVVQIIQDSASDPPAEGGSLSIEGRAAIDVRVLEVRTRLILLQDEFRCTVPALAAEAVECVVRAVAARLRQGSN